MSEALQVLNHFKGRREPFVPLDPERVTLYVCGMTVQGRPHMGHMLAFVSADLVRRTLEHFGYKVEHVQNFTDVDDKIIAKATQKGREWKEVAQENIDAFYAASDALNILRAHHYPMVTGHIPEILDYIQQLIDKGHAYAAGGSVWFDVRSYGPYGELSGRKIDDLRTAVRVELDDSKRDPLDFALWKGAKPGEPSWESPWGPGRPGWHIECSVMSTKYLGCDFDFHGGGRDLIFPHHENELAQSKALEGDFARYWLHNGLLTLDGAKMAKSTGHFFSVDEVLAEFDPDAVRFYLLRGHFRNQMEYSRERLAEAASAHDRMRRGLLRLLELQADSALGTATDSQRMGETASVLMAQCDAAIQRFDAALRDDFNAEAALAPLFELIREANPWLAANSPADLEAAPIGQILATLQRCLGVLGLFEGLEVGGEIPPEIAEMLRRREQARADRDFALADSLRDEIQARGFRLEDGPDGAKLWRE